MDLKIGNTLKCFVSFVNVEVFLPCSKLVCVSLILLPSYEESHVPVTQAYHLSDIFTDLLNFSAHHLVLGGRLVYWLPVYRPE